MIETITPYDLPPPTKEELLEIAAQSDLLLLGETHGTQEVPRLVLGLLDDLAKLGYGGLALELPRGQAKGLAGWAAGEGDPPPFFGPAEFRDGRGNVQTLSLIRQTLSHPGNWNLLCFDIDFLQEGEVWADRDRRMAEGLMEQWETFCAGRKVVAACGNYHSRLVAPAEPDFGPWPSFGHVVQQSRPELTVKSVNIVFHSGQFFNGEVKSFYSQAERSTVAPEMHHPGSLGHVADLSLPHAAPATFISD